MATGHAIKAVTFDLWDTIVDDDSDAAYRRSQGLRSKLEERRHLTWEALNRNYRIVAGDDRYVLRIAGDGTEEFIDRKAEEQCARVAADAGVNAGVIFFDPSDGLMLCRLIDDSVTMDGEKFKDLGAVARAARAFRAIHTCANPAEDFWAYATGRLARCRALMDSPGFASHLDAVRR